MDEEDDVGSGGGGAGGFRARRLLLSHGGEGLFRAERGVPLQMLQGRQVLLLPLQVLLPGRQVLCRQVRMLRGRREEGMSEEVLPEGAGAGESDEIAATLRV